MMMVSINVNLSNLSMSDGLRMYRSAKGLSTPVTTVRALNKVNRRATTAMATPEDNDFKRSSGQQMIYDVDSSVRKAQVDLGENLKETLKAPLTFLGMGGSKNGGKAGKAPSDRWESQYQVLTERVQSISAEETKKLMKKGWVFLDVRPNEDHVAFHPANAKNAPLNQYINVSASSPRQMLRWTLFKMQAVSPIESNPDFLDQSKAAIASAPGVIVACASGGTLQSTTNFPNGQPSRSLIAAYRLLDAGAAKKVQHLSGGLNSWFREGYEGEGASDEWDDTSGRTPSAAGYTPSQDSDELKANQ